MGVFIKNKTKRVKKSDENPQVLINTNINKSLIGEEIVVIEKKSIKSGLGSKKSEFSKSKNTPIDDVSNNKTPEKTINIYENPDSVNKKPILLLNKTPNLNSPFVEIIASKKEDDFNKNNEKFKSTINSSREGYYDFIFSSGLLTNNNIQIINNKLDNILNISKINLSFIDLYFFKAFIKNKSLALVANSSELINKYQGNLIDSHDIVIRFNSFKTLKEHTGEKTTIHASIYLQNENLNQYVPIRFILANSITNWSNKLNKLDKFKQGSILKYNHHSIIPNNFKEPHPSTTGFSTLIMLLKLGGYSKINMFGFNFYENGVNSIFRNDAGMNMSISKVNNYLFEKQFIMEYCYENNNKENIITFYDHSTL
jgi:hypothetical protein